MRKFIREGQAIRRLNACPNIVKVEHMTQTEDGYLILVMEFVDGGDLDTLINQQGALGIPEAMDIALQMAQGLKAAHDAGLIHRDIKPENVLLDRSGGRLQAKLIDFGIAADHTATTGSKSVVMGSVGYAAPEQWLSSGKNQDARTDLYALGATLFRMLTGRKAFEDVDDVLPFLHRASSMPAPRPGALRPGIPAALDQLVAELLAPQRENRPPNADAVIARLEALLRPAPVAPPPAVPAVPQLPEPVPAFLMAAEPKKRFPWLLVAIPAVAAGALGTWLATRTEVPPAPAPVVEKKVEEPKPQLQKPPEPSAPKPAPPKEEAAKRETAKPKPEAQKPAPAVTKTEEPAKPALPAVDHLKEGDAARDRGDFAGALQHYRQAAGGPARLGAMRRSVESEVEERVGVLSDRGDFAGAERLVDLWLGEYRDSQRLQAQKKLIQKRRESQ